ncbi:MAG: carboxymuconolactone decarboxylase family protein [Rhodobacteraceae bacterium]|nr:carboxymuconolactone decarboxylase family protein [Paracoccaceae bacterium]
MSSSSRLNYREAASEAMRPMLALEESFAHSMIPLALRELVKLRASQINGCAYCLDMHAPAARRAGVSTQKLDVLPAWRESPAFDARERAALGWCEALTRIEASGAPDAEYAALEAAFNARECVELTLVITTINAWNRIAVGFRSVHPLREPVDAA